MLTSTSEAAQAEVEMDGGTLFIADDVLFWLWPLSFHNFCNFRSKLDSSQSTPYSTKNVIERPNRFELTRKIKAASLVHSSCLKDTRCRRQTRERNACAFDCSAELSNPNFNPKVCRLFTTR